MAYDDYSPSGAAPMRAPSNEPMDADSGGVPPSAMEPLEPLPQSAPQIALPPGVPQFQAGLSDDLQVPWGWVEVALFVVLAVIASAAVTWGVAEVAVRFFRVRHNDIFGATVSTATSTPARRSRRRLPPPSREFTSSSV